MHMLIRAATLHSPVQQAVTVTAELAAQALEAP